MLYRKERNRYSTRPRNDKCYITKSVIGIAADRKTISAIPEKSVENPNTYFDRKAPLVKGDLGILSLTEE